MKIFVGKVSEGAILDILPEGYTLRLQADQYLVYRDNCSVATMIVDEEGMAVFESCFEEENKEVDNFFRLLKDKDEHDHAWDIFYSFGDHAFNFANFTSHSLKAVFETLQKLPLLSSKVLIGEYRDCKRGKRSALLHSAYLFEGFERMYLVGGCMVHFENVYLAD